MGLWVVDDTVDAEEVTVEGAVVNDIIVGVVTVEVGVPEDDGVILDMFIHIVVAILNATVYIC